jgi:very-short-patch-repair endonuclease
MVALARPAPRRRAPAGPGSRAGLPARARSLAELTLFEALEATRSTAGRFELNQPVSFHFGERAAEVDLLSRSDRLAIEVDGHHHFTSLDHYRRDRRKDALLQAHGYAVVRFLADDVLAEPRAAVRAVCEMLAHGRGGPGGEDGRGGGGRP